VSEFFKLHFYICLYQQIYLILYRDAWSSLLSQDNVTKLKKSNLSEMTGFFCEFIYQTLSILLTNSKIIVLLAHDKRVNTYFIKASPCVFLLVYRNYSIFQTFYIHFQLGSVFREFKKATKHENSGICFTYLSEYNLLIPKEK
jgi:hypothetical protein